MFLLFLSSLVASAQGPATESQVKAAYLYNFGKFVTWPAVRANSDSFGICVLGKNPFGNVLESTVAGESMGGKKIAVKKISNVQEAAASCSVLFISSSEERRLDAILAAAQHMNLLTVSDIHDFADRGGVIGLVSEGDRIRFEVNLNAAGRCHLTLSSELLKVAVRVIGTVPGS